MRIDLHCHSMHSKRASLWIMQKLGCPESFTAPRQLYDLARRQGMTAVTITDHNTIDGALDIADLSDTIVGCEYTTYFPEDRCKVHVLAYHMTEAQHDDLSQARENIFDFVAYLHQHHLPHVCAHPLYGVNDRLTVEHVEKLILLFKNWEWNGSQNPGLNEAMRAVLEGLTPETIERLANKHSLLPCCNEAWRKNVVGGSDDHSSLGLARTHTEVRGADTVDQFWAGVEQNQARVSSRASSPQSFARNIYGIAYQYYKRRFGVGRYLTRDMLLLFLDRMLETRPDSTDRLRTQFPWGLSPRRWFRERRPDNLSLLDLARFEGEQLIRDNPHLMAVVSEGNGYGEDFDDKWYGFVKDVSNKMLMHLGSSLVERVLDARLFDLFHSLGSAGALYALLAPYFVSFSYHTQQRRFGVRVREHFGGGKPAVSGAQPARVAHFTDTFHEVNGVARTLHQQLATAIHLDKDYRIVTCFPKPHAFQDGVHTFDPVGAYALPEYPELALLMPPFLEMLHHCYEDEITHLHVSTPGPVGLAALGIARILGLPIAGTYHTALPQYGKILTEDAYVEDLLWKYMVWFYDQLDAVFVPSHATAQELIERGIAADKVRVYPRGVNVERFHPNKRCEDFHARYDLDPALTTLLYVGRVSREKNLDVLVQAFGALADAGTPVQLVVAGDGPYREEMEAQLAGRPVFFTGYLEGEELAQIYASSDALVFPSTTDTFGNVVLEAQASGIPVIVTNQGGPQENVRPGETGLVVEGNNAEALAEAMDAIVCDPVWRANLAEAAREYMAGRSFENAFAQLWTMYVSDEYKPEDRPDPVEALFSPATLRHALGS